MIFVSPFPLPFALSSSSFSLLPSLSLPLSLSLHLPPSLCPRLECTTRRVALTMPSSSTTSLPRKNYTVYVEWPLLFHWYPSVSVINWTSIRNVPLIQRACFRVIGDYIWVASEIVYCCCVPMYCLSCTISVPVYGVNPYLWMDWVIHVRNCHVHGVVYWPALYTNTCSTTVYGLSPPVCVYMKCMSTWGFLSLVPRPFPVFQYCTQLGRAWGRG